MRDWIGGIVAAAMVFSAAPAEGAHFKLLEPASWLNSDDRGDPQKLGPCGGTLTDPGTPTNSVTSIRGGQPLRIRIQETIYHPGHYRVALSVTSRTELPPHPETTMQQTDRGPRSASAKVQPAVPPILADGILVRTAPPAQLLETSVDIPNINCEKCTLQIIQFMVNHPGVREGGFSYHHCADLRITADPSKPIDSRWPGQSR
jgi:hypothetical protein